MEAVRLVVSGRVQGVGYRAFLTAEAERLGLQGWVRNRVDGSVEALVGGPGEAIGKLIAACHRGPRLAHVAAVKVQPEPAGMVPQGFSVLPTA